MKKQPWNRLFPLWNSCRRGVDELDVELAETRNGDLGDELRERVKCVFGVVPRITFEAYSMNGFKEVDSNVVGVWSPCCAGESRG
jgi:hypothetical protein